MTKDDQSQICNICGAPEANCANISRSIPFTLSDDAETVKLDGEVVFWCDSSEPDTYYFHPLTGQRCEDISQCFNGWAEQDDDAEAAWAELRETHASDVDFMDVVEEMLAAVAYA